MLRKVEQDVQPGVTAFGDISSFQPVAKVRGPGCRRVPGAEMARTEGHGAAVLRVLPKGSGLAGKALQQEITCAWGRPAGISCCSLSADAGRHFSSFSACLQYFGRISFSSLRCSRMPYTHNQIIWALLGERIRLAAEQGRSGYTFLCNFIFFPATAGICMKGHIHKNTSICHPGRSCYNGHKFLSLFEIW